MLKHGVNLFADDSNVRVFHSLTRSPQSMDLFRSPNRYHPHHSSPLCAPPYILLKVYIDTSSGEDAPYLYLNGTRADGSTGLLAVLINGSSSSDETAADELTFVYTVIYGDDIGSILTVADRSAIRGGASLLDLQEREANVTLPEIGGASSLSGNASLSVYTDTSVVTGVSSSLPEGEYGVGQVRI